MLRKTAFCRANFVRNNDSMKSLISYWLCVIIQVLLMNEIYSADAGFFDDIWTTNDIKFLVITFFSMAISVLMLYIDKNNSRPKVPEILLTVMLASVAVILTYEWAIESKWSVIMAMIVAFFIGVFALNIVQVLQTRVKDIVNGWIDKYRPKAK
jgi:uncharacterized membrane protein YjjP (DUF1212 family)